MARSRSTRIVPQSGKGNSLLRKLTSNANLPSYIQQLPPPALHKLINEIGLEDSQEIMALVGAQQMREVLSVALWSGARPGQEEALNLDQFVRWIDIWIQDGEKTLTRRVLQLGEDFLVVCLTQLLTAVDRTVTGPEESGLEIGQYVVFPKQEKHWHRVVEMLTILWHHEPDFVVHALGRCSLQASILNDEISEAGASETLYQDVAAERAAQRGSVGYVNPTHAAMFLMTAKTSELKELYAARAYDLNTADYLRKQRSGGQVQGAQPATADESEDEPQDEPQGGSVGQRHDPDSDSSARAEAEKSRDFAALDSLLRDTGILEEAQAPVALLTDRSGARPRSELLAAALAQLAQTAPEIASRRLGELSFLSNVLMSGTEIQGKAFAETEAAKVAIATANLGATYLLSVDEDEPGEMQRAVQLLVEDPGVIRLFQIGYHLLCTLPGRCTEAVYRAKAIQARRPGHVVIREMDEFLGSSKLTDRVNEGAYGEAKSIIDGLSAVMDSAACVALRCLIDPTPCFPRVLDGGAGPEGIYVDKGHRYIATLQDIERIAAFLHELPSYCGN